MHLHFLCQSCCNVWALVYGLCNHLDDNGLTLLLQLYPALVNKQFYFVTFHPAIPSTAFLSLLSCILTCVMTAVSNSRQASTRSRAALADMCDSGHRCQTVPPATASLMHEHINIQELCNDPCKGFRQVQHGRQSVVAV